MLLNTIFLPFDISSYIIQKGLVEQPSWVYHSVIYPLMKVLNYLR